MVHAINNKPSYCGKKDLGTHLAREYSDLHLRITHQSGKILQHRVFVLAPRLIFGPCNSLSGYLSGLTKIVEHAEVIRQFLAVPAVVLREPCKVLLSGSEHVTVFQLEMIRYFSHRASVCPVA